MTLDEWNILCNFITTVCNGLTEIIKTDKFKSWAQKQYVKHLLKRYKKFQRMVNKELKSLEHVIKYIALIEEQQQQEENT